jgi:hypothetical protein
MIDEQRIKLLFGPYHAPAIGVGDRAYCLYRGEEVVVVDWTLAPIPWPICRRLGPDSGRGSLLVNEELARAIRCESATAVKHWWRVCGSCVVHWRKALGANRKNNPGSQRLVRAAVQKAVIQAHAPPTADQVEERRRRRSLKNVQAGNLAVYQRAAWTEEELALLGTMSDADVAIRLRRTHQGVQLKREKLGIACYRRMAG